MSDNTVTLSTEVYVGDVSDEQRQRYEQMAALVEENFETYVAKDREYGSAYDGLGELHETYDLDVFDVPRDAALFGIWTRLSDKHRRFSTLAFSDTNRYNEESLVDTALDSANYWLLVALMLTDEPPEYEDAEWPFPASTSVENVMLDQDSQLETKQLGDSE